MIVHFWAYFNHLNMYTGNLKTSLNNRFSEIGAYLIEIRSVYKILNSYKENLMQFLNNFYEDYINLSTLT